MSRLVCPLYVSNPLKFFETECPNVPHYVLLIVPRCSPQQYIHYYEDFCQLHNRNIPTFNHSTSQLGESLLHPSTLSSLLMFLLFFLFYPFISLSLSLPEVVVMNSSALASDAHQQEARPFSTALLDQEGKRD